MENKNMSNYNLLNLGKLTDLKNRETAFGKGRVFTGEELGLTGCEVSVNVMPAGQRSPFIHCHKKNEELYVIIQGKGIFYVDGEELSVQEGSMIRVAPAAERAIKADEELVYMCFQAQENSLTDGPFEDGIILEKKIDWNY